MTGRFNDLSDIFVRIVTGFNILVSARAPPSPTTLENALGTNPVTLAVHGAAFLKTAVQGLSGIP